jgi:hypothetical protein
MSPVSSTLLVAFVVPFGVYIITDIWPVLLIHSHFPRYRLLSSNAKLRCEGDITKDFVCLSVAHARTTARAAGLWLRVPTQAAAVADSAWHGAVLWLCCKTVALSRPQAAPCVVPFCVCTSCHECTPARSLQEGALLQTLLLLASTRSHAAAACDTAL